MAEDLAAFLRAQQVLGPNVHAHRDQAIRNRRPIPPAGHQLDRCAGRPAPDAVRREVQRDGISAQCSTVITPRALLDVRKIRPVGSV